VKKNENRSRFGAIFIKKLVAYFLDHPVYVCYFRELFYNAGIILLIRLLLLTFDA